VKPQTLSHIHLQVCDRCISASPPSSVKPWRGVEAVQSRELDHPHIVRTLAHTTVLVPPPAPPPPLASASMPGVPGRRSGGVAEGRAAPATPQRASFDCARDIDAGAQHGRAFATATARRTSFDDDSILRAQVGAAARMTRSFAAKPTHVFVGVLFAQS